MVIRFVAIVPWVLGVLGVLVAFLSRAEEPESPVAASFYQELDVRRAPQFVVQGVNVAQQIHYQVRSSFVVYEQDAKGDFKAVQTIENATLVEADSISQAVFAQSLAMLQGKKFTYSLDKHHEVMSMIGSEGTTEVVPIEKPDSMGALVTTVIDDDGWKELAELTLFSPLNPSRPKEPFVRKAEHDWGSLGSWYGKTTFIRAGLQRGISVFRYQHELEYIKPNGKGALPFEIVNAKFQAYEAGGVIQFDSKTNRVQRVQERFHAKGVVDAIWLGIETSVAIDEQQEFTINLTGYQKKSERQFSAEKDSKRK